jgi:hypothetical protein
LKSIFNLIYYPLKNLGKGGQAKKMTNKSERAVSAMPEDEFDGRFPDEKAAID